MKNINQKWDAFTKTYRTIVSCKTTEHVASCRNLIQNYFKQFDKDFPIVKYEVGFLNEDLDNVMEKIENKS
jgi:hypothetical protein